MSSLRPPIPKRLAARIRAAQAKVLDARGWIEGLAFNSPQDEARWKEYAMDPDAFARKHYPGHGAESYPVQTNISRIREKLDKLPSRMERNQRELDIAQAELLRVEAEVLEQVQRMRPASGRVPWPTALEPLDKSWRRN